MKHKDYAEQQRNDPDYLKAEVELRPALDLAEDIIRLRVERGWSQKELARRLGTRQANISRLEHGQANPTLKTLRKLSQVFEVDLLVHLAKTPTGATTRTANRAGRNLDVRDAAGASTCP